MIPLVEVEAGCIEDVVVGSMFPLGEVGRWVLGVDPRGVE